MIFPVFVTLTGCGLAFAVRTRMRALPVVVRRARVLLAVGPAYNAVITFSSQPDGRGGGASA